MQKKKRWKASPDSFYQINLGVYYTMKQSAKASKNLKNSPLFKHLILPEQLENEYQELLKSSWRINGVLPDDARLTVIYGRPKSYKSFVSLDMALSVATGADYHDKKVKQGSVLYIAAEGQKGASKRIKGWLQSRGIEKLENFYLFIKPIAINDRKACNELIEMINLLPERPELVFIDTLNRSLNGNENGDDMTAFVSGVTEIAVETQAQVIVIHHTPKNGEGMRGHSSLHGAVDYSYKVEKHKNIPNLAVMSCDNAKDHQDSAVKYFNMNLCNITTNGKIDTDMDGEPITTLVTELNTELRPQESGSNSLRGKKAQVYNALISAVKESGTQGATLEQWRQAYYKAHGNESSEKKAFSTHYRALVTGNFVDDTNGYYTQV
jgi:hypothetical protein